MEYVKLTQERVNKFFGTEIGKDLHKIYTTSDNSAFIYLGDAQHHCKFVLNEGDDIKKYNITLWYNDEHFRKIIMEAFS
jgi:hypothetical protein